jgi:DUF1365 family protein
MAYLDLDELPGLLGGRLVSPRAGLVRFRRHDYLGEDSVPLAAAVRACVEADTGIRSLGPIRLLTQLRSFGHCFNPVSFYYCFDSAEGLRAVVTEVTNTPWRERHAYVLRADSSAGRVIRTEFDKALHVSPFMSMDHRYIASAATPGKTLSVHIENRSNGKLEFDATLALSRRELSRRSLASLTARYPFATVRVLGLIYIHAVRLALAGVRVHPHPSGGQE